MTEGVTLAQRLRALASDREKTSPSAGQELERMAQEWERLEPVRAALKALAEASQALVSQPGWGLQTLFSGQEATLARRVAELDLAVEEVLGAPAHAGADGSCPDYGSTTDPCPPGCASGTCVALRPAPVGTWEPGTWADVKAADRIRVGGQHEAEVEVVLERVWLGSGAAQIPVKLKDRGHYTMPPSGPVEVWREPPPEPVGWEADAQKVLADAGLGPELISRS